MNSEKKFDDLIAKKIQTLQPEFEESKWEQAEKLIEADERKKKNRTFFFLSIVALGLISGLTVLLMSNGGSQKALNKTHVNPVSAFPDTLHTVASAGIIHAVSRPPVSSESGRSNASISTEKKDKEITHSPEKPETNKSTADKIDPRHSDATPHQSRVPSIAVNTGRANANAPHNKTQNSPAASLPEPAQVQENSNSSSPRSKTEKSLAAESADNKSKTQPSNSENPVKEEILSKTDKTIANTGAEKRDSTEKSIPPVADTVKPVSRTDSVQTFASAKTDSIKKANPGDSVNAAHNTPAAGNESPAKKWNVFLAGGVNYLPGTTITPIAGIAVTRSLTPRWTMGAGLHYTSIAGPSTVYKTSVSIPEDSIHLIRSNNTEISTRKMHYLVLPVFAQFTFLKQWHALAGVNLSFLFSTNNTVSNYELVSQVKTNEVVSLQNGRMEGLTRYDIALLGGLERVFFDRISTGLYLNYGLINLISPANTGSPSVYKNASAQFVLKYRLFSH
jgi:hypothetical protein